MNRQLTDKWVHISTIEPTFFSTSPLAKQIHVDTRDFHCHLLEEPLNLRDRRYPEITRNLHNSNVILDADEIIPLLKNLEEWTGGRAEWRLLNLTNVDARGWLKYIRLYRIKDTNKFIVCTWENTPFNKHLICEGQIEKKYLNTH